MKRALVLALLLGACATPGPHNAPGRPPPTIAASDAGGNRLEALVQQGDRFCTADAAWCADATGEFTDVRGGGSSVVTGATREDEEQGVWPFVIRRGNGHAIFGITFRRSEGYSGGGATMSVVTLYDVAPGQAAALPVVSLPDFGSASIRACFSQEDMRTRRQACADEYAMAGSINLDTVNTAEWPRLFFATEAWTYPGHVSRSEDSTLAPPLANADLIWVRDERCSYRRTLTYTAEGYTPDTPLPDCSDYATQ